MRRLFLFLFFVSFSFNVFANQTDYPPLTPENVMDLQEVARMGNGRIDPTAVSWSPNGESLIAAAHHDGLFYWERLGAEPEFINLDARVHWPFFASESLIFYHSGGNLVAYDLLERQTLYEVQGIRALAVSHNGEMLAYEVADGLMILELETGNLLYDFAYPLQFPEETSSDFGWSDNLIFFAQFNPHDNALIVGWQRQVVVGRSFERWVHTRVYTMDEPAATSIQSWYPEAGRDDNLLLYRGDGTVFTGNLDLMVGGVASRRNADTPYDFAGHYLAVANGVLLDDWGDYRQTTEIWDTRTDEKVLEIEAWGAMSFSPDGMKLTVGTTIYAIPSGEILGYLQTDNFYLMPYIADRIISFGYDDRLTLLDAASGAEIAVLPVEAHDWHVYPSDAFDGSFLLRKNDSREVLRLNSATGEIITHFVSEQSAFQKLIISSDFSWMYSQADIRPREYNGERTDFEGIWDFHTGELISIPDGYELLSPYFSPDGKLVLWHEFTDSVSLYDGETQLLTNFPDQRSGGGKPLGASFSPDGAYLLVTELDNMSLSHELFRVEEQQFMWGTLPDNLATAFSPDSQLFAYLSDGMIWVTRLNGDGSPIPGIPAPQYADGIEFSSPSVLTVRYPGDYDYGFVSYDVLSGEEVPFVAEWLLPQVFAETDDLSFAMDAGWLVISTEDGQVLQSFDPDFDRSVTFASMSSDASRLYFNLHDGTINIWAVVE